MTMTIQQSAILIAIVAAGTILVRFLPFILFPANRKTPKYISFLGKVIPYSVMGLLVVYCLKDISIQSAPYGLPEFISVVCVVLLHVWKKNTLLSIGGGTALYMVLVQNVFI